MYSNYYEYIHKQKDIQLIFKEKKGHAYSTWGVDVTMASGVFIHRVQIET